MENKNKGNERRREFHVLWSRKEKESLHIIFMEISDPFCFIVCENVAYVRSHEEHHQYEELRRVLSWMVQNL